jgi:hypothetical protein
MKRYLVEGKNPTQDDSSRIEMEEYKEKVPPMPYPSQFTK